MQSLTLDVYSLLQVRKMNTKIYKIQMLGRYGAMTAMPGEIRRTKPRVKTNCELASSHSEERGDGGGWRRVRKGGKEERDDATRINRVTVWMQHTSLPLTNKAVREKMLQLRRPLLQRLTGPVYSMSECV